jgi:hypothetical protein
MAAVKAEGETAAKMGAARMAEGKAAAAQYKIRGCVKEAW